MRTNSKKAVKVEHANVQDYHNGISGELYVFDGFESNKFFTSDRYKELTSDFLREDGIPLDGWGFEIETECWGIKKIRAYADVLKKVVFPLFPADLFKMQRDGSLGVYGEAVGIECITQIMKKSFIRNHYKDFQAMWDYFNAFGVSCTRSGHCGMHINISNALFGKTKEQQIEAIRKLHYFVNKHYDFCRLLFKRTGDTTYCGRMNYDHAKTMTISGGDHYTCMNYSHFNTGRIELRLVGGQQDYYHFRNTVECAFFLVERVRKIKWEELDNVAEFFKGCNQYVYKRLQDCNLPLDKMQEISANLKYEDLELV